MTENITASGPRYTGIETGTGEVETLVFETELLEFSA